MLIPVPVRFGFITRLVFRKSKYFVTIIHVQITFSSVSVGIKLLNIGQAGDAKKNRVRQKIIFFLNATQPQPINCFQLVMAKR